MRHDNRLATMKEIQNAIIDPAQANPQFKYPVAQIIRIRPSQFMASVTQSLEPRNALHTSFGWKFVQPIQ